MKLTPQQAYLVAIQFDAANFTEGDRTTFKKPAKALARIVGQDVQTIEEWRKDWQYRNHVYEAWVER